MQNDIINIKKNHIQAAEFVLEKVMEKFDGSKFIIASRRRGCIRKNNAFIFAGKDVENERHPVQKLLI